jgi:hypothetical protein
MAKKGRSYQSKRAPSPMAAEAARLREIVTEQKETLRQIRGMADEGRSDVIESDAARMLSDIIQKCDDALDGGGESS